jgi:hypothetical protein
MVRLTFVDMTTKTTGDGLVNPETITHVALYKGSPDKDYSIIQFMDGSTVMVVESIDEIYALLKGKD